MAKQIIQRWQATAYTTHCCFILLAALCVAAPSKSSRAEELLTLAQSKDWELVRIEDPFAEKSIQCQIRTRTASSGGRRERPLIIFDLISERVVVRPDMALQGSIELNRGLQGDTGDRGGRYEVVVRHGIRIDSGKLYSTEVRDSGSGSLEANFGSEIYAALAREVRGGTTIFYLWSVASSRKAFNFPIEGLRQLFPTAREECAELRGQ